MLLRDRRKAGIIILIFQTQVELVLDDLRLILLLPPKTASSSISQLYLEGRFIIRPGFRKLPFPHYHLYLSELAFVHGIDANNLSSYKIIQVVRNPIKRFISSWKHQERILGHAIELGELLDQLGLYKSLLPKRWEEFYLKFYADPNHRAKSFQKGNWGGLRFYVDQLDWNDLNLSVNYFKLEDLDKDISPFSDVLKIDLPQLPQKNKGGYTETVDSLLTYSQKEIVFHLFQRDFEAFNYEF